jgi:hypothetical protein
MLAVEHDSIDIVKRLIEQSVNPNFALDKVAHNLHVPFFLRFGEELKSPH